MSSPTALPPGERRRRLEQTLETVPGGFLEKCPVCGDELRGEAHYLAHPPCWQGLPLRFVRRWTQAVREEDVEAAARVYRDVRAWAEGNRS